MEWLLYLYVAFVIFGVGVLVGLLVGVLSLAQHIERSEP